MKKFTLFLILLAFGFCSISTVKATRQLTPTSMVTPASGSNINGSATVATKFTFVVTNTGTETIGATDSILIAWGQVSGTNITIHTPVNMLANPHKVLNPGDTFHYTYAFTFTSGGTIEMAFLASPSAIIADFRAITADFNVIMGIDERAKSINKVWFSNNNLNYELIPNSTCEAQLNIFNINGQLIKSRALNLVNDYPVKETLSLGDIPKGIYILSINTPYGTDTRKFIIQ